MGIFTPSRVLLRTTSYGFNCLAGFIVQGHYGQSQKGLKVPNNLSKLLELDKHELLRLLDAKRSRFLGLVM